MQCSGSGQNNECHPYFAGAEAGPDLERPNVRYHHGYSDAYIIFTAYILRAHVLAHVNLLNICSFDPGNLKMLMLEEVCASDISRIECYKSSRIPTFNNNDTRIFYDELL